MALLLLLLALSNAVSVNGDETGGQCDYNPTLDPRPHSVSILEFGAVGDGKTLNTLAFQNAIFYLKSFADKGGAQLYVPPGKWLTGSFNLTSHLTVFLEKGAVIIGSQVFYPNLNFTLHSYFCINLVLEGRIPFQFHSFRSTRLVKLTQSFGDGKFSGVETKKYCVCIIVLISWEFGFYSPFVFV